MGPGRRPCSATRIWTPCSSTCASAGRLVGAGLPERSLRPLLRDYRQALTEAGLFAAENPEPARREAEALLAGQVRLTAAADPAAARALLPYEAAWADAREDLANFEADTGFLVRPVEEGLVGFYVDPDEEPFLVLPLAGAVKQAGDPKFADDLDLLEQLFSGLSDEEAEALAEELVERRSHRARHIERIVEDRALADALLDAHKALRHNPDHAQEILQDLLQILSAHRGEPFSIATAALETALTLASFNTAASIGINGADLIGALDRGDYDAAMEAGLGLALDIAGATPLGRIAEATLRPIAKGLGFVKGPLEAARNRLRQWAQAPADHLAMATAGGPSGKGGKVLGEGVTGGGEAPRKPPARKKETKDTTAESTPIHA